MIVAFLRDPKLKQRVLAAGLPEEDVFLGGDDAFDALQRGFPRLVVLDSDQDGASWMIPPETPVLRIVSAGACGSLSHAWVAVDGIDTDERLRTVVAEAAGGDGWVEQLFGDLSGVVGRSLPPAFRGLCRRVLEYPARYADLHGVASLTGLSRGALKARFRRRGLRSPTDHVRWLRALTAAHVVERDGLNTVQAAYRLGFTSSGNFCRAIQATTGFSPGELRFAGRRVELLVDFARRFLTPDQVVAWSGLKAVFLREEGEVAA